MFNIFKSKNTKVHAFSSMYDAEEDVEEEKEEDCTDSSKVTFEVVRLSTIFARYGAKKHPKIESYKTFQDRGELIPWRYVPPDSTIMYISHETRDGESFARCRCFN